MSEIDDIIAEVSPIYKSKKEKGKSIPSTEFKLVYDSTSETLEPLYFWILDFMNDSFRKVEKIMDNFSSSPGSGHFSELQGKMSQMQQEASRVLGTVNNILKGVLNLIYDLKEFKIRLSHYEAADSKDPLKSQAGLLSLKQIWMDKVDIQRGAGSINALSSGDLNFVTLRDAFLLSKSLKDSDKLDLNERVKRILKPRLQEFFEWKTRSEQELKKRYEIERIYLKSQVDALKLNSKWAKPYLRAAQQLSPSEGLASNPALVTIFNTILLQLTIMGINPLKVQDEVFSKNLPKGFEKLRNLKKFNSIVTVEFTFRGIPSKVGQHYVFGGRADVTFKAYALNDEELALFRKKLEESDLEVALKLVQGMTDDSLKQIKIDIDELMEDKEKAKEKKSEDINPFGALFSFRESKKNEKKKSKEEEIKDLQNKLKKKENYAEKYIRNLAEANAMNLCFVIYDVYKKSHGMAAFPYRSDTSLKLPQSSVEKIFGFK